MSRPRGRNAGTPDDSHGASNQSTDATLKHYHLTVIHNHWDLLAAMAWQGHRLTGRGFVLLSSLVPDPDEGEGMMLKPEYVPMAPENPHKPPYVVPPLFSHYDPDTEFIVGVEQTNGLRAAYHMVPEADRLIPLEAAKVVNLPL